MGFWKEVQMDIDNGLSKEESIRLNSLMHSNDNTIKNNAIREYEEIISVNKFNEQIEYLE